MYTTRVYSLRESGNISLTKNFKVREFACKDGSDVVAIDLLLVWILQAVRDHFGKSVTITSGYRTPSYNKTFSKEPYSKHIYGSAADFVVSGVPASEVQAYLETLMPNTGGIGKAKNYTHVDTRATKSRWTY